MSALGRFAERACGVPLDAAGVERRYRQLVGDLDGPAAVAQILIGVTHNTEKAGALLAAHGMFVVVAIFAVDHGWPKGLCVAAMLLLLLAALIAISILRSTTAQRKSTDMRPYARQALDLMHHRMIRFNIALYLTFISLLLLGAAAIAWAL